jgi:hypothetical protein
MPSSVSTLADQSAHHGCDRLGHQLVAAAVGVETIVQPLGLAERQHVESVEVVQVRVTVGAQQAHGLGDMLAHQRQGQACATRIASRLGDAIGEMTSMGTSGQVSRIVAMKPRHVRSRSSSRASRAGQVRDGDAAVRHWVMELPYVTIRRRRGSSGRQTRASSGTSRPSRRA